MDIDYPVMCPLMGGKIEEGTCFDIHMVVDHSAPKWTMPEKVLETQDYEYVCKNCKYHRND